MPGKPRVIVDCDPGIDDFLALSLLAANAQRADIVGITVVHGNLCDMDQLVKNTQWICSLLKLHAPIVPGARVPLVMPRHDDAAFVHGYDGVGGIVPKQVNEENVDRTCSAAEWLVQQARTSTAAPLDIIAVGPLTNVALALAIDPVAMAAGVRHIYIMGGTIGNPGNARVLGEANVVNDPHAARLVLNNAAGIPVTLAPLNVTHQVELPDAFWEDLRDNAGEVGDCLYRGSRFCMEYMRRENKQDLIHGHDPTAIFALFEPDLFTQTRLMHVDVDCESVLNMGTCVADLRIGKDRADEPERAGLEHRVNVLLKVDNESFKQRMRDQIVKAFGQTAGTAAAPATKKPKRG